MEFGEKLLTKKFFCQLFFFIVISDFFLYILFSLSICEVDRERKRERERERERERGKAKER